VEPNDKRSLQDESSHGESSTLPPGSAEVDIEYGHSRRSSSDTLVGLGNGEEQYTLEKVPKDGLKDDTLVKAYVTDH
jgi:hypothetical protein